MKILKKDATKIDIDDRNTWPEGGDLCVLWPVETIQTYITWFEIGETCVDTEKNVPIWSEGTGHIWPYDGTKIQTGDLYVVLDIDGGVDNL